MQIAEKSRQALMERGKAFRKTVEYNQFLRRLIAAYSSPSIEPKYDYSELIAYQKEQAIKKLDDRFENDRKDIITKIISLLPNNSLKELCSKKSPDEAQKLAIQVIAHLVGHPADKTETLPTKVSEFL